MRRLSVLPIALLALGCASSAASVPILASSTDINALVGRWSGQYSSAVTGRSGSIVFTLRSAGDSAHGDVVMTPRGSNQPYTPVVSQDAPGAARAPATQVLTISFVRVAGPVISGTLAPYRDPDCDCTLHTTFSGTMSERVIEGTFTTRGLPGGEQPTGEWRVRREK